MLKTSEKIFFSSLLGSVGMVSLVVIMLITLPVSLDTVRKILGIVSTACISVVVISGIWSLVSEDERPEGRLTHEEKQAHARNKTMERVSNQFRNSLQSFCEQFDLRYESSFITDGAKYSIFIVPFELIDGREGKRVKIVIVEKAISITLYNYAPIVIGINDEMAIKEEIDHIKDYLRQIK